MSPKSKQAARSKRSRPTTELPDLGHAAPPPERDDPATLEFLKAIDQFKRTTGRSFPSWTEVLQVVHALGYRKVAPPLRRE